jgi:hypothetical protein
MYAPIPKNCSPLVELERQEVEGEDLNGIHLEILMIRLPEKRDSPLPQTRCLGRNHTVARYGLRISVVGELCLG